MEPVLLRTARLELRAPTSADVDAITSACQDQEIPRWTTVPSPYTREHGEGFVDLVAQWWSDGSQAVWGLYDGDTLVGVVGLHHITEAVGGGHATLGYWMVAEHRGRGLLTEACRAAIDWGFTERGLTRILWQAVVGNVPSARAARALGFRYEGLIRQGLTSPRGRDDGWQAGLLASDDRMPAPWPVLD